MLDRHVFLDKYTTLLSVWWYTHCHSTRRRWNEPQNLLNSDYTQLTHMCICTKRKIWNNTRDTQSLLMEIGNCYERSKTMARRETWYKRLNMNDVWINDETMIKMRAWTICRAIVFHCHLLTLPCAQCARLRCQCVCQCVFIKSTHSNEFICCRSTIMLWSRII